MQGHSGVFLQAPELFVVQQQLWRELQLFHFSCFAWDCPLKAQATSTGGQGCCTAPKMGSAVLCLKSGQLLASAEGRH